LTDNRNINTQGEIFGKAERLHSRKLIERLFKEGDFFFKYPFKVFYFETEKEKIAPVGILISVSKKNFKKAVDRNKIKRLIRESYRKNKSILYESDHLKKDKSLLIGLIYTAKTILPFKVLEKKIILILRQFFKEK